MKNKIIMAILIVLFLFTRFYLIDQTLFFFNDMGRDLMVLYEWLKLSKFPILGPQTSALPINQSPIYFYLLMPFYLLTGLSEYSAIICNAVFYVSLFLLAINITKPYPSLRTGVLLTFLLITLNPQHIMQGRFVWNPSFLPPLLVTSLFTFLVFFKNKKQNYLWLSAFLTAVAISFHYSAIVVIVSYAVALAFFKRKILPKFFLVTIVSLFILNITTLFQLLKRLMLQGYFWQSQQVYQTGMGLVAKINSLILYVFGIHIPLFGYLFLFFIFGLTAFYIFKQKKTDLQFAAMLFLLTTFLTLLSPFNLQAHYIFAISSTFFVFITQLNKKVLLPLLVVLLFFYLQPLQIKSYFTKSARTVKEMNNCYSKICQQVTKPIFVSVTSSLYPYHYGPEHRYLLVKNGCNVVHIEEDKAQAKKMLVIEDSGKFTKVSMYYELELFGNFIIEKKFSCTTNLSAVLLKQK